MFLFCRKLSIFSPCFCFKTRFTPLASAGLRFLQQTLYVARLHPDLFQQGPKLWMLITILTKIKICNICFKSLLKFSLQNILDKLEESRGTCTRISRPWTLQAIFYPCFVHLPHVVKEKKTDLVTGFIEWIYWMISNVVIFNAILILPKHIWSLAYLLTFSHCTDRNIDPHRSWTLC